MGRTRWGQPLLPWRQPVSKNGQCIQPLPSFGPPSPSSAFGPTTGARWEKCGQCGGFNRKKTGARVSRPSKAPEGSKQAPVHRQPPFDEACVCPAGSSWGVTAVRERMRGECRECCDGFFCANAKKKCGTLCCFG